MANSGPTRTRATLILLFSGLCLANLISGVFFSKQREARIPTGTLEDIRWSIGTNQDWNMFHTIPTIHSIDYTIVGETADGEEREFGWSIPGLKRYALRDYGRYHYLLIRMIHFSTQGVHELLDQYAVEVAKELRNIDPEVEQFSLRVDAMMNYIPIQNVKEGDPTSGLVTEFYGPYPTATDE